MGGGKATLELRGSPLISYPLDAFTQAGIETVVIAKNDSALPPLDVPVWKEPDEPSHPLRGIVTALERAEAIIACACDMPFLTPELLDHLARRTETLVVPKTDRLHPLLARYEQSHLAALREGLGARRPLQEIVAELDPVLLDETALSAFGDPQRLLFNVNTPEDLARAERL
jgi:molybdopterin-guanine dinucleotide biosynthesis protein A